MKKYLVIDETIGSDISIAAFDSLEEANNHAEWLWGHLTRTEQQRRKVCVGLVTEADLNEDAVDEDGEIEWAAHHSYRVGAGFFNSANIAEEDDE